jgi:DNA helicase-2/ATP-dependent DNA helicase PcrA
MVILDNSAICGFDTRQDEAEWVAQRISDLLGTEYWEDQQGNDKRGLTKSDIAILFRSVKSGDPPYHREFTTALENADIKYTIEAEGSIFERPHSRVVREAMGLLRNPGAINRPQAESFFTSWVIPHFPNADLNTFLNVLYEWNREIHVPSGGARRKVYPQKLVHDLLNAFGVPDTQFTDHDTVMRDLGVFSSIVLDIEKVYVSIDGTDRYQEVLNFFK